MTKQQPTDKDGFAILRSAERTKFSAVDRHNDFLKPGYNNPRHTPKPVVTESIELTEYAKIIIEKQKESK